MTIDGHNLPCYFADGFRKPTTKTPFTLVWFSDDFCLTFTLQDFFGRLNKIENRYLSETGSFVHSTHPEKPDKTFGLKGTSYPPKEVMPNAQSFLANLTLFNLHKIMIL